MIGKAPVDGWRDRDTLNVRIARPFSELMFVVAGSDIEVSNIVVTFGNNEKLELPAKVVFREGTRTAPGAAPDYKPGIAALYREIDVPVHPIATNAGVHWPKHGFTRKPGIIVFEYLEPIQPGLKRAEFMRTLQERTETASNALLTL